MSNQCTNAFLGKMCSEIDSKLIARTNSHHFNELGDHINYKSTFNENYN